MDMNANRPGGWQPGKASLLIIRTLLLLIAVEAVYWLASGRIIPKMIDDRLPPSLSTEGRMFRKVATAKGDMSETAHRIRQYLSRYPDGRFVAEADDAFFDLVKAKNSPDAKSFSSELHELIKDYRTAFPKARHAQEAEDAMSGNCRKCCQPNQCDAKTYIGDYLKLFPDGAHAGELDDALYKFLSTPYLSPWSSGVYLSLFPDGRHVPELADRLYKSEASGSAETYLKLLPNGKRTAELDDKLFKELQHNPNPEKIELYFKFFPKGRHCGELENEFMKALEESAKAIEQAPSEAMGKAKDAGSYEKNVISDCKTFLSLFPNNANATKVRELIKISECRIDFLKSMSSPSEVLHHLERTSNPHFADHAFFGFVLDGKLSPSDYLKAFPAGAHVKSAEEMLEAYRKTGFYSQAAKDEFQRNEAREKIESAFNEVKKRNSLAEYLKYAKDTELTTEYAGETLREIARQALPSLLKMERGRSCPFRLTYDDLAKSPAWQTYALRSSWNGVPQGAPQQFKLRYEAKDNGSKSTGRKIQAQHLAGPETGDLLEGSFAVTLELYALPDEASPIARLTPPVGYSNFLTTGAFSLGTTGKAITIEEGRKIAIDNIASNISEELSSMAEKLLQRSGQPSPEIRKILKCAPSKYSRYAE